MVLYASSLCKKVSTNMVLYYLIMSLSCEQILWFYMILYDPPLAYVVNKFYGNNETQTYENNFFWRCIQNST